MDTWQASANEPITLRVPRGMALALMAGLLGLLLLAYWVGHSRGGSATEQRLSQTYNLNGAEGERTPPFTVPGEGGAESDRTGREAGSGTGSGGSGGAGGEDTRVRGSNYLILATYPEAEARRLQAFLTGRGVDVMVGIRNNKGLCQVIALKGFTREQYKAGLAEQFRTEMLAHGRAWKAANQGKGDDLNTMFYAKHEPPELR